MIKFENTEVFNFEGAIRGMRNPLNSWDKSDSEFYKFEYGTESVVLGKNDLDLAQRLIKAGSDHRKFLRQIFVSVDITAPLYWWKEFDTYKVGTVANSCSTMHKIHEKEFTNSDFSYEHLFDGLDNAEGEDDMEYYENPLGCLEYVIAVLEHYRVKYNNAVQKLKRNDLTLAERKHVESQKKAFWWQMIQLLPTSYNQKRTVTLNYEVLRNIYGSRKGHKLDEWSIGFMEWIDTLPYSEEFIKS